MGPINVFSICYQQKTDWRQTQFTLKRYGKCGVLHFGGNNLRNGVSYASDVEP